MRHCILYLTLIVGIMACYGANDRYNYLLFSNNYVDVRKGINLGADVEARLRGSTRFMMQRVRIIWRFFIY